MSNKHALSVFTHSCLSTPRNPRTKLPSSRLDEQLNWSAPHISYHDRPHTTGGGFRHSRSRQGTEKTRENDSFESSLHSVSGHHATLHSQLNSSLTSDPHGTSLSQLTGSVPMAKRPDPDSLSGNVRPSTSGGHQQSTDYSTLFTTLLESNSLLREEIKKLREEQQQTLSTVEQLNRRDCAVQTNGMSSAHSSLSNRRKNGHSEHNSIHGNGENGVLQSLPQRLLENTWIESSSEHSEVSLTLQEHSVHSLDKEALDHEANGELDSLSSSSLDSVSVEEVDAEHLHMNFDVPLPEHQALDEDGLLSTSNESLLSSCTESSYTSESGSRPSQVAEDDPFASPGIVAVEKMWDDFSVDEYAPYTPGGHDDERKNRDGTKEWTPRITIPEPFSMTVRDANSQKTKSRSMLLAEEERLKKEALEEAELRKKFHSSPLPATTYLPLYELINAKNEQRREQIKQASKAILKSTEKPFSFTKREDEKRKNKLEALRLSQEFERAQQKKESMFVAKPVSKRLFDSSVDDKIQEQEEYRRIRIQMRAEELMSKSKLPGSMQVRGREYTIGALRKKRLEENQAKAFLTDEHKFHPAVSNDVPDYDQAYFEFQNELARRKEAKQTTTTKPFYLRTQMIPSRREQVVKDMETDQVALPENRWPFVGSRMKATHMSPKPSSSSVPYPAQMTKTAKVRESLTKEKLASESKKELLEEDERRRKREREKLVRQSVTQKSLSLDPTAWLEEKKRQKLQEVR